MSESERAVQALVFDPTGALLAEISPEIESVAWRLNDVGLTRLALACKDAKCTKTVLRYGNRLLLQFANGLPDWAGVFDVPRRRSATGVISSVYTSEHILSWRHSGLNESYDDDPGTIAQSLITNANAVFPTGISFGDVYTDGTARAIAYHNHQLLDAIRDLVANSGEEFYIEPVYEDGSLSFRFFWYSQRGVDRSDEVLLSDGKNVTVSTMDEMGPMYNACTHVGKGTSWGDERPTGFAQDVTSRGLYDRREISVIRGDTADEATLEADAAEQVALQAYPRERFSLKAYDVDPAGFEDYDVGDVVTLEAFLEWREWYYEGTVRIRGREWYPDNSCRLEVETWAT